MRTVLRDTRVQPPPHLRRRHTPDLPNRVQAWSPWPRFEPLVPGSRIVEDRPLTRALTCAKRHMRREVLFATRRTNGAGSRNKRKSTVEC